MDIYKLPAPPSNGAYELKADRGEAHWEKSDIAGETEWALGVLYDGVPINDIANCIVEMNGNIGKSESGIIAICTGKYKHVSEAIYSVEVFTKGDFDIHSVYEYSNGSKVSLYESSQATCPGFEAEYGRYRALVGGAPGLRFHN